MAAAAGLYFVGTAIAGAIKRKREAEGVGKVERIKRRIYKEVSLAQQAGVDFSKKFPDLTGAEKEALVKVGEEVGWKQSKRAIESGKTYAESYYNSLRRAWNAVSGVEGIGRAYNVKDANGNVVLTWIEDAAAHVEAERRTLEAEARAAEARKSLQRAKRAAAKAASEPTTTKTIQQQILEKVPYLRTMWEDSDGIHNEVRDDFQYVVWVEVFNENTGEKVFEGAKIATLKKSMADQIAGDERRSAKWAHVRSDEKTTKKRISVIPVNKVNIDRISGIGYPGAKAPFWYGIPSVEFIYHGEWGDPEIYYRGKFYNAAVAEEEMYEWWKEELNYGDTTKDFDTWMADNGDRLKNEVIPYMQPTGYMDNYGWRTDY